MNRIVINLLLVSAIVWGFCSMVANAQVVSLDHMSLDVGRYSGNREPMTPEIPIDGYKGYLQLNWNVSLLKDAIKWENKVKTAGTYSKFQTVYWEYQLSIPTRWGIEPFIYHKSQHTMDSEQPLIQGKSVKEKFPVQDAIGIRFTFFNRGNK